MVSGGSDQASKILKFGEFLIGALENYSHYACDNHITETAFEEVQKIPRVVRAEKAVKLSYSIFKNSASQRIRLAEIGRQMKRRTVRPRGLFTIKFLTSEDSETAAALSVPFKSSSLFPNAEVTRA